MTGALERLVDQVRAAIADGTPLAIRGGGTKDFHGGEPKGQPLSTRELSGIGSYEPSELVITARAGTPLAEVEAALAEHGQWLAFEPPRFAPAARAGAAGEGEGLDGGTLGGMVAAGLAGPARASRGGVRDFVLGATLLDGHGELLSFGGQVMKNVAGYDVSRVLAGSMGILGLICEVSLKVVPMPAETLTLRHETDQASALRRFNEWAGQPLPLDATAWWDQTMVLRLQGAAAAVRAAAQRLGGEMLDPAVAAGFWRGLRDHRDEFFVGAAKAVEQGAVLWRLSVPSTAPPLKLSGEQLVEWNGAQRWLCTSAPAHVLHDAAQAVGGHAVRFCGGDRRSGHFAPLQPALERIHRDLKRAFDPKGIFNPGRLMPGL